jgi:hypothetical protein
MSDELGVRELEMLLEVRRHNVDRNAPRSMAPSYAPVQRLIRAGFLAVQSQSDAFIFVAVTPKGERVVRRCVSELFRAAAD